MHKSSAAGGPRIRVLCILYRPGTRPTRGWTPLAATRGGRRGKSIEEVRGGFALVACGPLLATTACVEERGREAGDAQASPSLPQQAVAPLHAHADALSALLSSQKHGMGSVPRDPHAELDRGASPFGRGAWSAGRGLTTGMGSSSSDTITATAHRRSNGSSQPAGAPGHHGGGTGPILHCQGVSGY